MKTVYVIVFAFLLFGCSASSYTMKPVPIAEANALNEFSTSTRVELVNDSLATESEKWTAPLVTYLGQQLEQRGATIGANDGRQLKLEVASVEKKTKGTAVIPAISAAAGVKETCQVTVRVETGDGYTKSDTVDSGAYNWQTACDQAVTQAVVNILNDSDIRAYLEITE